MISLQHLRQIIGRQDYKIGFINEEDLFKQKSIYDYISWLKLGDYHDGWFADPFILDVDEKNVLILVEEWVYKHNKGRISKLTVRRSDFSLLQVKPVLELDTHLSFPNIIRENGSVFVYPENAQSGCLRIYEYDETHDVLHMPKVLINEPLVDSQIVRIDNQYYLFGTPFIAGALDETKCQNVYKSDSLFGPFELMQIISSERCDERGAGEIYYDKDRLIRPCQDCDEIYGKAVILKQLLLNNERFEESSVLSINSDPNRINGQSLHTYNRFQRLCVIDGTDYHYRQLAKLYKCFISSIR